MNKITTIAASYIGQKEKPNNSGFVDPVFESKMRRLARFYTGAPWCAFFAELVWIEAEQDATLILPSAVGTMVEASGRGNWHTTAVPGAVAVWRKFEGGNKTNQGHVAIVESVAPDGFTTIEGNTNAAGGREGDTVARKQRSYSWHNESGLRLMGFVHPN